MKDNVDFASFFNNISQVSQVICSEDHTLHRANLVDFICTRYNAEGNMSRPVFVSPLMNSKVN